MTFLIRSFHEAIEMVRRFVQVVRGVCSEVTFSKVDNFVRAMCLDPSMTVLVWSDSASVIFEGADKVTVSVERLKPFTELKVEGSEVVVKLDDGRKRKIRAMVAEREIDMKSLLEGKVSAVISIDSVLAGALKEMFSEYDAVNISVTHDGASFISTDGVSIDEMNVGKDRVTLADKETDTVIERIYNTTLLEHLMSKSCNEFKIFETGVLLVNCGEYSFFHAPSE